MVRFIAALFLALGLLAGPAFAQGAPTPEQQAEIRRIQSVLDALHPRNGDIALPSAKAHLALGETYYFLDAADARRVLVEIWGNPPGSAEGVLGMVLPAGASPASSAWGAVVSYSPDGYVSDSDAASINYSELLETLRGDETAQNRERQQAGYAAVHLVGWAQQPSYDPAHHSLVWAKDIQFSDSPAHTLNYDVRSLGRAGVLSMNIVASTDQLAEVGAAAAELARTASFDPGARYADYKPGLDRKAEYGLAGLIAGVAALAVAKKAGLIGIVLLVLKKGAVFFLAGFGAVAAWFRKFLGGKKKRSAPAFNEPAAEGAGDLSPLASPEPPEDLSPYPQPPADPPTGESSDR